MRFRTLWEADEGETVVVSDIHDDVNLLHAQIDVLVDVLPRCGRHFAVTYWESSDEHCGRYVRVVSGGGAYIHAYLAIPYQYI
jgi:hypothetical protein